jgi:hypothetical protein
MERRWDCRDAASAPFPGSTAENCLIRTLNRAAEAGRGRRVAAATSCVRLHLRRTLFGQLCTGRLKRATQLVVWNRLSQVLKRNAEGNQVDRIEKSVAALWRRERPFPPRRAELDVVNEPRKILRRRGAGLPYRVGNILEC